MNTQQLTADLATARKARILFSHHSVGENILTGIRTIESTVQPGTQPIRLSSPAEAATNNGPMLIHFFGGENGDPKSKIDAFASTIEKTPRLKPDLAFMKFCYVDFNPHTDVNTLFNSYRETMDKLKTKHPDIRFAHITVPLVERPTELKWRIYRLIGKEVWEDTANVRRTEFNQLLKQHFAGEPIFDLAQVEALSPEGKLTTFEYSGQRYPSLYPGYTEDGGHLNATGQQAASSAALRFIADSLSSRRTVK